MSFGETVKHYLGKKVLFLELSKNNKTTAAPSPWRLDLKTSASVRKVAIRCSTSVVLVDAVVVVVVAVVLVIVFCRRHRRYAFNAVLASRLPCASYQWGTQSHGVNKVWEYFNVTCQLKFRPRLIMLILCPYNDVLKYFKLNSLLSSFIVSLERKKMPSRMMNSGPNGRVETVKCH